MENTEPIIVVFEEPWFQSLEDLERELEELDIEFERRSSTNDESQVI